MCLFLLRLLDGRGRVVDDRLLALHVDLPGAGHPPTRQFLDAVAFDAALTERARAQSTVRLASVQPLHARAIATASARQRVMTGALSAPVAAFQPGMFDQRAARDAECERQRRVELAEEYGRAAVALDEEAGPLLAAAPRLALVLVVP